MFPATSKVEFMKNIINQIIFNLSVYPLVIVFLMFSGCGRKNSINNITTDNFIYPVHNDITVTVFWIGEPSGPDNNYIPNDVSAWDERWQDHYGGVDDPDNRNGYNPSAFTPKENPFYFALPYNDFDINGLRKQNAAANIYWWAEKIWSDSESSCKNRWIKITKDSLIAYAQWEDVGPNETNDINYVFGNSLPINSFNAGAGLDVSPAVETYLGLTGVDTISWQFIEEADVPGGPWKQIITASQISRLNK